MTSSLAECAATKTYSVTRYEIRGNTALAPEVTLIPFTNAVGQTVTLTRICQSLASLRKVYLEKGYLHVAVTLPEQQLTNGIVFIDVKEGFCATNSTKPPPATFEVRHFEVKGNTLLSSNVINQILNPTTGPAVTFDDIRKAAGSLQRAYRDRGYVTVAVSVPSQRLTNATLRLQVTEGILSDIQIIGNRYFSPENIRRALPILQTNTLLNGQVFQSELDEANQNRDRQIYPTLGPGPDPGTSSLALRVKDRLPLHAHLETDNYSTPGTPELRINAAAQYNNLWQKEHQIGVEYSFSPQQLKTIGNNPNFGFNQPLISSYSTFYRMPLAGSDTLDEQLASSPQFGYQEATHQFKLPPAQSKSELTTYASASSTDTGMKWSNPSVIQAPLETVVSQDSGQNLTANQNIGSQYRFPLLAGEHSVLSGFAGADYKRFAFSGYNWNNISVTTVTTNQFGSQTNLIPAEHFAQPTTSLTAVYFPLNAGMEFTKVDRGGSTALSLGLSGNFLGSTADFSKISYSSNAQGSFVKATLSASRDQKLPAGCSLFARANGQAASGALIGNEQFALGGMNSVRGYYEGDQYGDSGWSGGLELRSPYIETHVASLSQAVPAWMRASVFTDVGQRFLMESSPGVDPSLWLWGAGFGFSANLNNYLEARVIVAWPLLETANTSRGDPHAYFTIGGQF